MCKFVRDDVMSKALVAFSEVWFQDHRSTAIAGSKLSHEYGPTATWLEIIQRNPKLCVLQKILLDVSGQTLQNRKDSLVERLVVGKRLNVVSEFRQDSTLWIGFNFYHEGDRSVWIRNLSRQLLLLERLVYKTPTLSV